MKRFSLKMACIVLCISIAATTIALPALAEENAIEADIASSQHSSSEETSANLENFEDDISKNGLGDQINSSSSLEPEINTPPPISAVTSPEQIESELQSLDSINFKRVDTLEDVVGKPAPEILTDISDLTQAHAIDIQKEGSIEPFNLKDRTQSDFKMGRGLYQVFTDVLSGTGDAKMLYPISLQPGEILQATLKCPAQASLDYDLYLYEFDMATGNLNTNAIDMSVLSTYLNTYSDGSTRTVDEGVATVNTTTSEKLYALQVYSSLGGSATEKFELILSLDNSGNHDSAEPNENPFHAVSFPSDKGISGATLNVQNDHDWFLMDVQSNLDYDKLSLSIPKTNNAGNATSGYYDFEVYVAEGSSMKLLSPESVNGNEKTYVTPVGYYYIEVLNSDADFVPSVYAVVPKWILKASNCNYVFLSDIDPPYQTGYPQGVGYWYNWSFRIKAQLTSASGYAVKGVPVTVRLELEQWRNQPDVCTLVRSNKSDENGIVELYFKPASEPGNHSANVGTASRPVIHQYAIDSIYISSPGLSTSSGKIYHWYTSY